MTIFTLPPLILFLYRKRIKPYVASLDRQGPSYWPVIKTMMLESRSWQVLKDGAMLVDLPGLRGPC
jgi:D-serine deaminase-like pyridoxal phosphate-dependent protein